MNQPSIPSVAWERLTVITAIIGDIQGRVIATVFYFTILVPFGLISVLVTDPLYRKGEKRTPSWIKRDPVDNQLDGALRQG
ncbi:MAG: hypothetical protein SF162_14980 [bacterium]|nr:hypothetical protein [bacterium]